MSASSPPIPTGSLSFPLQYHRFTQRLRNLDFAGRGTLEISEDGERFRFTGKRAGLFGSASTLELERVDITNVHRDGDRVTFQTNKGKSGKKHKPFLFYCASDEQARQIKELLPSAASDAFLEDAGRIQLLDAVCPPLKPFSSPTNWLIALNAIVFALFATLAGAGWFEPNIEPYIRYGANNGGYTTNGEWYRLFTSLFLHYGLVHVLVNMWVLAGTGHLLERIVGRGHFLALYFGSGLCASLASIHWYGDTVWSAGASGAVFGIFGALLAVTLRCRGSLPASVFTPIRNSAIVFIGYNLLFGATREGVDNAAHLGGLATGFALGLVSAIGIDKPNRPTLLRRALPLTAALAGLMLATGTMFAPTFNYNPNEHIALGEQWEAFAEAEEKMLATAVPLLERSEQDDRTRIASLKNLDTELIPFYQSWTQQLDEQAYTEDTITDRNRDRLRDYTATRAAAFEFIRDYLQANDLEANIDLYYELLEKANGYIEAFE